MAVVEPSSSPQRASVRSITFEACARVPGGRAVIARLDEREKKGGQSTRSRASVPSGVPGGFRERQLSKASWGRKPKRSTPYLSPIAYPLSCPLQVTTFGVTSLLGSPTLKMFGHSKTKVLKNVDSLPITYRLSPIADLGSPHFWGHENVWSLEDKSFEKC